MPDGKMMKNIEEDGYKYGSNKERIHQKSEKYTKVKVKCRKYYFGRQLKSSFHCKIWSRNHKLDQDGT